MVTTFLVAWVVFLVAAIPYVLRAKHPRTRALAAWLVFVSIFSITAAVLYFALGAFAAAAGLADALGHPAGAAVFLALVFVPAFLAARWQLKRPPRQVAPE